MMALIQGRNSQAFVLEQDSETMILIYQNGIGRKRLFAKVCFGQAAVLERRQPAKAFAQAFPTPRSLFYCNHERSGRVGG